MVSGEIGEVVDTSGFYKEDNGEWFYAPNFVHSPAYTLERGGNQTTTDGWEWLTTAPTAYIAYLAASLPT